MSSLAKNIVAILLFLILLFLAFYFGKKKGYNDCIENAVPIYDTTIVRIDIPMPSPSRVDSGKVPPEPFDTLEFIRRYLDTASYRIDTTVNDVRIQYDIGLNRNRIFDLSYTIRNERATHLMLPEIKNSLFIGAMGGPSLFAPEITYRRNKWYFKAGYNFWDDPDSPTNQRWLIGVGYRCFHW